MDIRNVQKTGSMFYVYLPTLWCKKYGIRPGSKVAVTTNSDGSLSVSHHITERKARHLSIDLGDEEQSIINKIMVASYINPTSSFRINLSKSADIESLLSQKKLISIEMVEFDGRHISCESSIAVEDPLQLLKTMARKAKNMVSVVQGGRDSQLLQIYEDEIDRSKLLIEKSVISRLTFSEPSNIHTVYLHYIALISKDLEKAVDQLSMMQTRDRHFLQSVESSISLLLGILDRLTLTTGAQIDYHDAIPFARQVEQINPGRASNMESFKKLQIKQLLSNISEVLFDWSVSQMIQEKGQHSGASRSHYGKRGDGGKRN